MSLYRLLKQLLTLILQHDPLLEHDDPLEDLPPETVEYIVEKAARIFVENDFAIPAAMLLEITSPVSRIASQMSLPILWPVMSPFVGMKRVNAIGAFFNDRENIVKLVERIQVLQSEKNIHSKV